MRQITIKKLRTTLNAELKNLPFEVIKDGKTIAIVTSTEPIETNGSRTEVFLNLKQE